jgi:hypothetical protein
MGASLGIVRVDVGGDIIVSGHRARAQLGLIINNHWGNLKIPFRTIFRTLDILQCLFALSILGVAGDAAHGLTDPNEMAASGVPGKLIYNIFLVCYPVSYAVCSLY